MTLKATMHMSLRERLNYYSAPKANGCREWTGGLDSQGYGQLSWKNKHSKATRLSWEEANGKSAKGKFICHTCDNKKCIEPAHLYAGTHADNTRDAMERNRVLWGPTHGSTKLTVDAVLAIRADRRRSIDVAAEHGIHFSTVSRIKNRENWRHLPDEET